jgi:hypothetical protein
MNRIELRLRFERPLPERLACPLCGLASTACEVGLDEVAFVCVACRSEVVAVTPPAQDMPSRDRIDFVSV